MGSELLLVLIVGLSSVTRILIGAISINFSKQDRVFLLKTLPPKSVDIRHIVNPFNDSDEETVHENLWIAGDDFSDTRVVVSDGGLSMEESIVALSDAPLPVVTVRSLSKKVGREQPSVRLIVHQATDWQSPYHRDDVKSVLCVTVFLLFRDQYVAQRCSPEGDLNICTVDMLLPLSWWSKDDLQSTVTPGGSKKPKRNVKVGFSVNATSRSSGDCPKFAEERARSRVAAGRDSLRRVHWTDTELEMVHVSEYTLLPIDGMLSILVPNLKFYPGTIFTIAINFHHRPDELNRFIQSFKLRCEASSNLNINSVEKIPDGSWSVAFSIEHGHRILDVSAFYAGNIPTNESLNSEVVIMTVSVSKDDKLSEELSELLWTVEYSFFMSDTNTMDRSADQHRQEKTNERTLNTRFTMQKDSLMGLFTLGRSNLINTAIMSGRQVSVAVKVCSVTYAGIVSEVTLSSACLSAEPSVLKVTPSCTAVYVDGTESRGSASAVIEIEFGEIKTEAHFSVWYPEMPVSLLLANPVLQSISGWQVPEFDQLDKRDRRFSNGTSSESHKPSFFCRTRYQESQIKVFGRFRVDNPQSGWHAYLGTRGRQVLFDLTALTKEHLRVADSHVATLYYSSTGNVYIQGLSVGYTDVQVLSPFSRLPYGGTEVQVTNEFVSIRKVAVHSLCALNGQISASDFWDNVYKFSVTRTRTFFKRLQECFLNVVLEYSDGTKTALSELPHTDFEASVETSDGSLLILESDGFSSATFRYLVMDELREGTIRVKVASSRQCLLESPSSVETTLGRASVIVKPQRHASTVRATDADEPSKHVSSAFPGNHRLSGMHKRTKIMSLDQSRLQNDKSSSHSDIRSESAMSQSRPPEIVMYCMIAVCAIVGAVFSLNCLVRSTGPKLAVLTPSCLRVTNLVSTSALFSIFRRDEVMPAGEEFIWVKAERFAHAKMRSPNQYNSGLSDSGNAACPADLRDSFNHTTAERKHGRRAGGSYMGSEVSIYMSDHPVIEVHEDGRRASSWNISRSRSKTHALVDSSSERNISQYTFSNPSTDLHWNSRSLGLNEAQLQNFINSLRETIT
uniref:TMEM132 domain-containing protein n=1 Tax=Trichuris muris TaxID=70415 RepID=A0A5S6QRH7_TRIMR